MILNIRVQKQALNGYLNYSNRWFQQPGMLSIEQPASLSPVSHTKGEMYVDA